MKKIILSSILMCLISMASAQKTYIGYVFPSGGARGSEFIIEIGGQTILGCKQILISGKGVKAEVIPVDAKKIAAQNKARQKKSRNISDEDNMQLSDKVQVKITIDKNAPLGIRDLKVVSKTGMMSNRLFFEVGEHPNFKETEPNGTIQEANKLPSTPMVINGQVEKGGRDFFSFSASKGQILVAQTKARAFVPYLADAVPGWFQAVTTLYDSDFNEVAFNDDYDLVADPTIIYKIEKTGDYYIEIQDAIFRGRSDFVYRIAVGEIPFVTSIFPLGWKENSPLVMEVKGVNLGKEKVKTKTPSAQERYAKYFQNKKKHNSNPRTMQISDQDEVLLSEDLGDDKASATELKKGQVINARIDHKYDKDWYFIDVEANSSWIVDVTARRLGSVLDASITIFDKDGKVVKKVDDTPDASEGMITHHADPQLEYKFKSAGRYYIRITDIQNKYGDNYAYRLKAYTASPDFSLRIEPSAISLPQGGTAHVTVFIERKNGFRDFIEIKADNLPEGITLSEGRINYNMVKFHKLSITSSPEMPLGKIDLNLYGEAKLKDGTVIKHKAAPVEAMLQAFYITHLIPTEEFRVDITAAQPFYITLEERTLPIMLSKTEKTPIKAKIHRKDGYKEPITMILRTPNRNLLANPVTVLPDQDEVTFELEIAENFKGFMPLTLFVLGTVKPSTASKVAGQKKNSISAAVMVNSPLFNVQLPRPIIKKGQRPQGNGQNRQKTAK